MDARNYASLEASRRLVEAGIVLETEASYFQSDWKNDRWELFPAKELFGVIDKSRIVPAPSMAEVWRELPESKKFLELYEEYLDSHNPDWTEPDALDLLRDVNRLIDLLIWVRKRSAIDAQEGGDENI